MAELLFTQLNHDWNAEPNAPRPRVETLGGDVRLTFFLNPFVFTAFNEGDTGVLRFVNVEKFRVGPTNDEGWYQGQCRFSESAPKWGEFYLVSGDETNLREPDDWRLLSSDTKQRKHFLFYFRDETFECVAMNCQIEGTTDNALLKLELPEILA